MRYLSLLPVKKVINFYTKPFRYLTRTADGVLYPETGLKGPAAAWAYYGIENNSPANLVRVKNTEDNRQQLLSQCDKVIYAAGFEQNILPNIAADKIPYDDTTGISDKNLFGIGIAFPERIVDAGGNVEHRISIPAFITYLKRILPIWIQE